MKEQEVKTNSLRAWVLAARPKTLTGAAVPVMIALALAWTDGGREHFRRQILARRAFRAPAGPL